MSGMINSADKLYLVYYRGNAMHFQGFKSEEDMAEQLLYQARIFSNEINCRTYSSRGGSSTASHCANQTRRRSTEQGWG